MRAMIEIACRGRHGTKGSLCDDCDALWDYAQQRLERCPFSEDKPTCRNCRVHCYRMEQRAAVRDVMRYAGPRMAFRHPWMSLLHLWDGFRGT